MSIQLECISLIIPKTVIEKYYPGGFDQYRKDNDLRFVKENYNIWFDDDLVKEGAMNPMDMDDLLKKWTSFGVKTTSVQNKIKKWKNVCVVASLENQFLPCDWLIFNDAHTVSFKRG